MSVPEKPLTSRDRELLRAALLLEDLALDCWEDGGGIPFDREALREAARIVRAAVRKGGAKR